MTLTLMDYSGDKTDFEIGSLDDIECIDITVISGDEIADVYYKNGTNTTFDSSNTRLCDFYDYSYTLYDSDTNLLNQFEFRNNSYNMNMLDNDELTEAEENELAILSFVYGIGGEL